MSKTIVHAVKHQERLLKNIGKESWVYRGIPVRVRIRHETMGIINAWLFQFNLIEQVVQDHMVVSHATTHYMSQVKTINFLRAFGCAIPCDDIELIDENGKVLNV